MKLNFEILEMSLDLHDWIDIIHETCIFSIRFGLGPNREKNYELKRY